MSETRVSEPTRAGMPKGPQDLVIQKFDAEAWHVMQRRDDALIEQEVLNGAGSNKFVYAFKKGTKDEQSGISVVGARHLASFYGGMKHRLVGSVTKVKNLLTFTTFPTEGVPMGIHCAIVRELEEEDDFYACIVEVTDLKTGNSVQMESRESMYGISREGKRYEKVHFSKVAQAKAYRNAVLSLIPQDVSLKWKMKMLALDVTEYITDDVIAEKRAAVMRYATSKGILIERRALEGLTLDQIDGLSDAARENREDGFRVAAEAAQIVVVKQGDELSQHHRNAGKPKPAPAKGFKNPATNAPREPTAAEKAAAEEAARAAEEAAAKAKEPLPEEKPKPQEQVPAETQQSQDGEDGEDGEDGIPLLTEDGEPMALYGAAYDWAAAFVRHAEGLPDQETTAAFLEHNAAGLEAAHEDPATSILLAEAGYPTGPQTGAVYPPRTRSGTVDEEPYLAAVEAALKTCVSGVQIEEWGAANEPIMNALGSAMKLKVSRLIAARKRLIGMAQPQD